MNPKRSHELVVRRIIC